ncbi:Hypothetical predicted protein, partial [Pelobates cultripes]
ALDLPDTAVMDWNSPPPNQDTLHLSQRQKWTTPAKKRRTDQRLISPNRRNTNIPLTHTPRRTQSNIRLQDHPTQN